MSLKVQAVLAKPASETRRGRVAHGVNYGKNYVFVDSHASRWSDGVGEFAINLDGHGEAIDYQAVLTWRPGEATDRYLVPLIPTSDGFAVLPAFNMPHSGYDFHCYSFCGRIDQGESKSPMYLPMYLVAVYSDGYVQIDRYEIDRGNIVSNGDIRVIRVKEDRIYQSAHVQTNTHLLQLDLPGATSAMAKYILAAWQTVCGDAQPERVGKSHRRSRNAA